jgi:hypothetical protein
MGKPLSIQGKGDTAMIRREVQESQVAFSTLGCGATWRMKTPRFRSLKRGSS